MKITLKHLLVFSIIFFTTSTLTYAQRRNPQSNQNATTEEGRRVILRNDGTWIYADDGNVAQTVEIGDVSISLIDCRMNRVNNQIICNFRIRNLESRNTPSGIYKGSTKYTDNLGNESNAKSIKVGNRNEITLIKNTPVILSISFDIVDEKAKSIRKLTIARSDRSGNVNQFADFTDIIIKK